jgi:hypothetical protein
MKTKIPAFRFQVFPSFQFHLLIPLPMKTRILPTVTALSFLSIAPLLAQETKTSSQEDLEAKFKEAMTGVTMSGRWCPIKEGVLGEEKEDRYTIVSVEKGNGDAWTINAKMKYGNRDVVAPIPVQVKWAGDTAVIVVDKMSIPGPGSYGGTAYSARVLVYENTYAGSWSGGNRAGLLKGLITKDKPAAPESK